MADRDQSPLSMVMIDLDLFKKVNDTHGHLAGDALLTELSRMIEANVREYDVVARYAGDEFAVILPRTDNEQAAAIGERVRAGTERPAAGGRPARRRDDHDLGRDRHAQAQAAPQGARRGADASATPSSRRGARSSRPTRRSIAPRTAAATASRSRNRPASDRASGGAPVSKRPPRVRPPATSCGPAGDRQACRGAGRTVPASWYARRRHDRREPASSRTAGQRSVRRARRRALRARRRSAQATDPLAPLTVVVGSGGRAHPRRRSARAATRGGRQRPRRDAGALGGRPGDSGARGAAEDARGPRPRAPRCGACSTTHRDELTYFGAVVERPHFAARAGGDVRRPARGMRRPRVGVARGGRRGRRHGYDARRAVSRSASPAGAGRRKAADLDRLYRAYCDELDAPAACSTAPRAASRPPRRREPAACPATSSSTASTTSTRPRRAPLGRSSPRAPTSSCPSRADATRTDCGGPRWRSRPGSSNVRSRPPQRRSRPSTAIARVCGVTGRDGGSAACVRRRRQPQRRVGGRRPRRAARGRASVRAGCGRRRRVAIGLCRRGPAPRRPRAHGLRAHGRGGAGRRPATRPLGRRGDSAAVWPTASRRRPERRSRAAP